MAAGGAAERNGIRNRNKDTMRLTEKKFYPWVVVGLLWVVALLNYMDRQMLSTMQGNIALDISALRDAEAFGALMAIFLWVYGIASPFSGAVADRLSRKWLIVGSLGVWSGVTWAMGYCTDFHQLMWLRGVMGISEALYIPSALSLIADYFTGKGRSLAIGLHMTGLYCGQALGGFGSLVATTWSWQATFHWFGIIGIAYALLLVFLLREKAGHGGAPAAGATNAVPKKKESVARSFAVFSATRRSGLFSSSSPQARFRDGRQRTGSRRCSATTWGCRWNGRVRWPR